MIKKDKITQNKSVHLIVCRFIIWGEIMNGNIKIKSKTLLKGDTLRLFFISIFSFIIRRGTFAIWLYCLVNLFKSGILNSYSDKYNDALVYSMVVFDIAFVTSVLFLFISALKLGEQFLYFIKASGGRGRTGLLFSFFTFEKSIRAFSFYLRLTILKFGWLMYFLLPCAVTYGLTFYLYSQGALLPVVFYIMLAGSSVLLSFCVFMWRIAFFRYNAAPYYLCLNSEKSAKEAIRKSIKFTDGFLRESVFLESSFFAWFLSCGFIVPFVYVIPYFRISKALFVVESLSLRAYPKAKMKYAINYLKMK